VREYSKVSPHYWSGRTGREFRGNRDAQVVSFYLMTCHSANMIGLYYMPLPTLLHEIGIPLQGARKALQRVSEADFAYYDDPTEYVWVPGMAREQIGLSLDIKDHRHKGVLNELEKHRKSPFFNNFIEKYSEVYHLNGIEKSVTHRSPLKAPSKPLRSQEQEQEQNIGGKESAIAPTITLGEFSRVRLTEQQHAILTATLNGNLADYVARFDRWVNEAPNAKVNGVMRKDRHAYESIRNWFDRDVKEGKLKIHRPHEVRLVQ
jgi:hypothetical protein